jgi:hypothetical protein
MGAKVFLGRVVLAEAGMGLRDGRCGWISVNSQRNGGGGKQATGARRST